MSIDNQNTEPKPVPTAEELSEAPTTDVNSPETGDLMPVHKSEDSTPSNVETSASTDTQSQPAATKTERFTKKQKITAIIAGSAIAFGIGGGLAVGAANQVPTPQTTSSGEPNPSTTPEVTPSPSLPETVPDVATNMEFGQTPEVYTKIVETNFNNWVMAGSKTISADWTAEVARSGDASTDTRIAFVMAIAEKNTIRYATALFGPDYTSNSKLDTIIKNTTTENASNLDLVIVTSNDDELNHGTPFIRSIEFDTFNASQVLSQAKDGTTLDLALPYTEYTNAQLNKAKAYIEKSGGHDVNGNTGVLKATLIKSGNSMVVDYFQY